MATISIELGKLMALVDTLQKQLVDIKKEVCLAKTQITDVHTELINFMGTVQPKAACQALHESLRREFVPRVEIAPIKTIINVIVVSTAAAICAALLNLILK